MNTITTKLSTLEINDKLTKKQIEIDKVFKLDENKVSEWISKEDIDKNNILKWGNNGITRQGLFYQDDRYNWEFKRKNDSKCGKIEAIRINGINTEKNNSKYRPIRDDIRRHYLNKTCVVCGSSSSLVIDHKNDLYNDRRVLNIKLQNLNDFQCLCNHCNLQKRQIMKKTLQTGKRYGATNIPMLSIYGIDFIEGNEFFDKMDINAMVGTFWYDPIKFMEYINENLKSH